SSMDPEQLPIFPSYRLLVCVIAHLGKLSSIGAQGLLGATLLTMVQRRTANSTAGPSPNATDTSSESDWRYDWDKMTQGWVLSSYFIGYYVMQFPVGWLANRFGGKRVATIGALSLAFFQLVAIATAHQVPVYFILTMTTAGLANKSVPWLKILTSPPVFAVAVAQLGSDWMVYCMITVIPSYFKHVRNMETHKVDMLCGLPWLATPILGYLVSRVVDFLRKRGVPTNLLRKTADAIDDKHSQPWVMLLYGLPVLLLNGFVSSSHNANVVEMSPEYAGVVYGLSQTVAMTSAFIAPVLVEAITPHDSPQEWRNCFAVIFGVSVVTFLIYALLGSSEPQDWGPPDPETQRLTEGKVALRY
ncbi:hypothetical protein BaRGS_00008964, partial [Batillaria attramentaria]